MKDLIYRWTARHGISPERRAREEPLRAELLRRILIASFIALVVQAALSLYHSNNLWWFLWGTIEPSALLLIAAVTRKRQPSPASILVVVALSHLAAFTDVRFGQPYLGDALLALTIIVCGQHFLIQE